MPVIVVRVEPGAVVDFVATGIVLDGGETVVSGWSRAHTMFSPNKRSLSLYVSIRPLQTQSHSSDLSADEIFPAAIMSL